jgi:hypothetical protein
MFAAAAAAAAAADRAEGMMKLQTQRICTHTGRKLSCCRANNHRNASVHRTQGFVTCHCIDC